MSLADSSFLSIPVVLLVLLWLLPAILFFGLPASWLAVEKGRSEWSWFLLALVLGPLAILLLGLAPRGPQGRYQACPECSEAVFLSAVRCPFCGYDLLGPEQEASTEINPSFRAGPP